MSNIRNAKCIICRSVNSGTVMHVNSVDEILAPGYYRIDARGVTTGDGLPQIALGSSFSAYLEVVDTNRRNCNLKSGAIGQTLTFTDSSGRTAVYHRSCSFFKGRLVWSEWEATVEDATVIVWGTESHINNYTEQGSFDICGKRNDGNDGLPIANSSIGQPISAKLFVIECDTSDKNVCVTQLLVLSGGCDFRGSTYMRTGVAVDKYSLQKKDGAAWSPWGRFQQNVDVGAVLSFDAFVENGVYSGVYVDGSAFLLVVVNNRDAAKSKGQVTSVSQYKYALGLDGTFSYEARAGRGDSLLFWSEWAIINSKEIDSKVNVALQEKTNALLTELSAVNGRVAALSSGLKVSLSVSPAVIHKGVTTSVTLKGSVADNAGAVIADCITILTSKGNAVQANVSSFTTDDEITTVAGSVQFAVSAECQGLKLGAKATVSARYPVYVGMGTTPESVVTDINKMDATTSATNKTYSARAKADNVSFYLLVPTDVTQPASFSMGGAPFAMKDTQTKTIGGVQFKIYQSGETYDTGTTVSVETK